MDTSEFREKVQQLKELLRLPENEAVELLQSHDGDLERVISFMESSGRLGGLEGGGAEQCPLPRPAGDGATSRTSADPVGSEQDPIDLTKDSRDQEDIQKALMLSMQDLQAPGSGVISLEEQELSRALEASLRESNASMSKPVLALFQDPKNPHKRRRVGQTPVGLKNIGNTCWFSAVIQSLFHIPTFRAEILAYSPPPLPNGTTSHSQCVAFVIELQKIFMLLLKSDRMYIDPSPAIQSLREAFSKEHSPTGAQQDVSEFTHKLLEWIENAFKLSLDNGSSDRRCNPIVRLFNGHYRTEGISNDQHFVNESDFGAYPIQVRGHTHLHDSLDSASFDMDMQQQTFFTRFPPILVLELSRFHYNQNTQQAEKIHDKLDFDLQLCVDRYLEENKEESCRRKKEVDQLRRRVKDLESRLKCYTHYGQRPIAITDILSLTLSFVHDQTSWEYGGEAKSGAGGEDREERQAEKRARVSLCPSPRYCGEQEAEIMGACLTRWTKELSQDMDELFTTIAAAKTSLEAIYNDPLMKRTPYFLHSVLVHQGEASGGHYWAYTRKHPSLSLSSPQIPLSKPGYSSTPDLRSLNQTETLQQSHAGPSHQEGTGIVGRRKSSGDIKASTLLTVNDGKASSDVRGMTYHRQSETGEVCIDIAHSMESVLSTEEVVTTESHEILVSGAEKGERMEIEKFYSASSLSVEPPSSPPSSCPSTASECSWIKFNDVSVSEVKWEEVRRESLGGTTGNTSAYCLVYLNSELHQDWLQGGGDKELHLGEDLVQYAANDNSLFFKEIEDYDRNIQVASHINKSSGGPTEHPPSPLGIMSAAPESGAAMASCANASPPGARRPLSLLAQPEHAPHAEDRVGSQELMQVDSPPPPPVSPTLQNRFTTLIKAQQFEISQLETKFIEPRIINTSSYVFHSGLPKRMVQLFLLDDLALNSNDDTIKFLAKKEFIRNFNAVTEIELMQTDSRGDALMQMLKQSYEIFLSMCWCFVTAIKCAKETSFPKSLLMCLKVFQQHKSIVESRSPTLSLRPAHLFLLRRLRSKSLQEVSSMAYRKFESSSIQEGIQIAVALVVPTMNQIAGGVVGMKGVEEREAATEEVGVVEKVREEWCQCLNRPQLTEAEQDRLGDLLTSLLDDGNCKTFNLPSDDSLPEVDAVSLTSEFSSLVGQLPQLLGTVSL